VKAAKKILKTCRRFTEEVFTEIGRHKTGFILLMVLYPLFGSVVFYYDITLPRSEGILRIFLVLAEITIIVLLSVFCISLVVLQFVLKSKILHKISVISTVLLVWCIISFIIEFILGIVIINVYYEFRF
jgi:hypothetical protein